MNVGVDVPVADRAALGYALGLALGGQRPVVRFDATHSLWSGLEVLAEAVRLGATLVVRVPYGGEAGPVVDRPVLDALLAISGLTVAVGNVVVDAAGPVVVLEPRTDAPPVPMAPRLVRDGSDVTLLTWGSGVDAALAASFDASVAIVDLVVLSSLAGAAPFARRTGRVVIVDPGDGVGERLVWSAVRDAFDWLESRPEVCGPADVARAVRDALAYS